MPRPKKNKNKAPAPDTPSAQLFAEMPKTPKLNKANLLEDSDDEDTGFATAQQSPAFKVNADFARRFEHNKKREEMQRLEEKFAKQNEYSETDDDSSSEDEDDIGVLATETLDSEIFATLNAIKNKDPRVYDGKSSFYTPIDPDAPVEDSDDEEKAVKPMFLRDYHRENLLAGNTGEDLEEDAPATFVQQQAHLKRSVVQEMHTAADAEGEDDDGFLVRKSTEKKSSKRSDLPDPALADKDPEEFLNKFLASRAWTKSSGGAAYVPIESDDSEDEDIAEQYEAIYNRRFEDPDAAARAKLVSYGRDAISENTVRRDEKSRRKKAREEKRRKKEEAKAQLEMEKGRLKKLKTEELMEKFKLIKEAAELEGDEETEAEVLHKLLEGDFSDKEWDAWMQERFGDKYYEDDGRPKKPTFDDDININDIVPDFVDDVEGEDEETDSEVEDEEMADAGANDDEEPKKKSKKEIVREKQEKKSKDKSTRRKFERFVEDNFDFDAELGSKAAGFRYRETTPEAYGLGTLDILAADDADLNAYAGLKKYAAFRDEDKKKKDKKRYGKKKLLKQWRKDTFGSAEGVQMPANWKPEGLIARKVEETVSGKLDIKESGDGERKKKRRRKTKA